MAAPGCPLGVPSCHGGGTRVSPRAITVAPGCPSTTPSTWAVPSVSPHAPGAAFSVPSVSPPRLSPAPSASPSSTERRRRSAWKSAGKQERTLSCRQSPANTPRHRLSTAMSATWGGVTKAGRGEAAPDKPPPGVITPRRHPPPGRSGGGRRRGRSHQDPSPPGPADPAARSTAAPARRGAPGETAPWGRGEGGVRGWEPPWGGWWEGFGGVGTYPKPEGSLCRAPAE